MEFIQVDIHLRASKPKRLSAGLCPLLPPTRLYGCMEESDQPQGESLRNQEQSSDPPSYTALPRKQVILTLGGVILALFLSSLDQTIVSTAMPSIIADLEGFDRYTWVTTAYLVASTTAVPVIGKLTDMYGRKWFFIGGIGIFLVGSVLAGISQTMTQLIVFRAVQGIGGGIMMANAFITIGDLFPPAERAKYQGMLSGVFGVSSIIGPMLGGFVTDQLSWHWVFFINLPVGIPVLILFIALFPDNRPAPREHRLDVLGIATLVLAVVPTLLALSWGGVQFDWDSATVIGFLSFGGAMALTFLVVESRAAEPILPLSLFRNQIVSVTLLAAFLTGFAMFSAIIFIPLYFQGVLGTSATSSGSFLTPMMLGGVTGSIISGQILSRTGGHYRVQGLIGLSIFVLALFLLSRMDVDTSRAQAVVNIVLLGLGMGVTFPLYTIAVQNSVPLAQLGVATSSIQFFRSIGGVLGLAVLGSLLTNRFSSRLADAVPAEVRDVLAPGQLESLANNPQALVNPDAQAQLEAGFSSLGPEGPRLLAQLLFSLQETLAKAISDVFLVSLFVVMAALVATVFLKQIALQGRPRSRGGPAQARPELGAGDDG